MRRVVISVMSVVIPGAGDEALTKAVGEGDEEAKGFWGRSVVTGESVGESSAYVGESG